MRNSQQLNPEIGCPHKLLKEFFFLLKYARASLCCCVPERDMSLRVTIRSGSRKSLHDITKNWPLKNRSTSTYIQRILIKKTNL